MAKAKKKKSAKKTVRKAASKAGKTVRKAAKRVAKSAKRVVKKAKKAVKRVVAKASRATAKRPAKKKAVKRAAPKARKSRDVIGEGNYTASRNFRREEETFVRANKSRIPEMGKEAEAALEGSEGPELERAEDEARSHARE